MAKFKFYAVRRGHTTGIFRNWYGLGGAEEAIEDFVKPEFNGFNDENSARQWLINDGKLERDYDALVDRLVGGDKGALREAEKKARLMSAKRKSNSSRGSGRERSCKLVVEGGDEPPAGVEI